MTGWFYSDWWGGWIYADPSGWYYIEYEGWMYPDGTGGNDIESWQWVFQYSYWYQFNNFDSSSTAPDYTPPEQPDFRPTTDHNLFAPTTALYAAPALQLPVSKQNVVVSTAPQHTTRIATGKSRHYRANARHRVDTHRILSVRPRIRHDTPRLYRFPHRGHHRRITVSNLLIRTVAHYKSATGGGGYIAGTVRVDEQPAVMTVYCFDALTLEVGNIVNSDAGGAYHIAQLDTERDYVVVSVADGVIADAWDDITPTGD